MRLLATLSVILLGVLVVASHFSKAEAHEYYPNPIQNLMPRSGSGHHNPGLNCLSWRFAVETNNLQGWKTVPEECVSYVGHYMMGAQYRKDCSAVATAAYAYAKSLQLKNDGKEIWIFDIDETSLSNVPYYARPNIDFGALPYNATSFNEWVVEAKAPAIPSVLNLYKRLLRLGVKIVFLTGTSEQYREQRMRNMKNIGYHNWEKMILKQENESHLTAIEYKSTRRTELQKMGYTILGNIGDQWSDLLGPDGGARTFKLPNPMYYVS